MPSVAQIKQDLVEKSSMQIHYFDVLPPSLNGLYSNAPSKGRVKSKAYRAWEKDVSILVVAKQHKTIEVSCAVNIMMVRPDKRIRMDLANREKALIDRIVKKGYLLDDSLIDSLWMRWTDTLGYKPPKGVPSIFTPVGFVTITPYDA